MSEFGLEILLIIVLILLNSVLAMSETALLSVSKARLQHKANEGDSKAQAALKLTDDPNQFLSTIQVGITLIDVFTGALGGATLALVISNLIEKIPILAPYGQTIGLFVVVITITYMSLIIGELVPKRLALHNPERIASFVAGPMMVISKIFSPFTRFLGASTDLVLRILRVSRTKPPPVTEEEIQVLIDQGTQAGIFEEAEQDMVENVFRLNDQRVNSLMTPRTEIIWLDVNDTPEEIRQKVASSPYSRFPVCKDSLDHVLGLVKAKELLLADMKGEKPKLKQILRPSVFIPETAFGSQALEVFKEGKTELLLVIDEFGVVQGLLSIYDIMEEIVGEIETGKPQATQRQDGSWLLDGMLPADNFKEIFNLRKLPHEDEFETLGGFIMTFLGRVPKVADHFEWGGLRFEVMDMDDKRIDKILVTTLPTRTQAQQL